MQGCEEANVKKRLIIVFAVIAAVLLLIPVRKVYEDGGTHTYTSLTYYRPSNSHPPNPAVFVK